MDDVLGDARELMLAPDGEDDQDTQHVTIWNRVECRKVAGNAAPLRRNLGKYLSAHPECEVYQGQDKQSLGVGEIDSITGKRIQKENEHVAIWHNTECRKITGNAAPLRKNLDAYLKRNPNCVIYNFQDRYLDKSIVGHKQKAKRPPFVPEEQKKVLQELQILPQIAQLSFMNSEPLCDAETTSGMQLPSSIPSNATSAVSTEHDYTQNSALWYSTEHQPGAGSANSAGTSGSSPVIDIKSRANNHTQRQHQRYLWAEQPIDQLQNNQDHEDGMMQSSWVSSPRVETDNLVQSAHAQLPRQSEEQQQELQGLDTKTKATVYAEMPVAVSQLRKSLSIEQQLRVKQPGTGMSIILDNQALSQISHLEGVMPHLSTEIKSSLSFFLEQNGMGMKPSVSFLGEANEYIFATPMAMSIENNHDPLFADGINMQTPQEFGMFFNHGFSLGKSMDRPRAVAAPGAGPVPVSNLPGTGSFAYETRDMSMGFSPSNYLLRNSNSQYME